MSQSVFTPQAATEPFHVADADRMTQSLLWIVRAVAGFAIIFTPFVFWMAPGVIIDLQKAVLLSVVSLVVVTTLGFLSLRSSRCYTVLPMPLFFLAAFCAVAMISSWLSSYPLESWRGLYGEVGTTLSFILLFIATSLPLLFQQSKKLLSYVLMGGISCVGVLIMYTAVRALFGPAASFGIFSSVASGPLGGINDVAVLAGATVSLALVSGVFKLNLLHRVITVLFAAASLVVLVAANVMFVWLLLGVVSGLLLVYALLRFLVQDKMTKAPARWVFRAAATSLFVMSILFLFSPNWLMSATDTVFSIEYFEVRPSLDATADVARATFENKSLLFGAGPNQFSDMWEQYKDPALNETVFWNTSFTSGNSFVSTLFVTTGLLGGGLFVLFHAWFIYSGVRTLILGDERNKFWFNTSLFAFFASLFLWLSAYFYTPGLGLLLIAGSATGVALAAMGPLLPFLIKPVRLVGSRRSGVLAIVLVVGVVTVFGFFVSETVSQYRAHSQYAEARQDATTVDQLHEGLDAAYRRFGHTLFLETKSELYRQQADQFFAMEDPTEDDITSFTDTIKKGMELTVQASSRDLASPEPYAIAASLYHRLAMAGVSGASERAVASLGIAQERQLHNPLYNLYGAQMAQELGDVEQARAQITAALKKKTNYIDALQLLSTIDIQSGDLDSAIQATIATVQLDPDNAARYFQLGGLYEAIEDEETAFLAYNRALDIDPGFANARYARALLLYADGQTEVALSELQIILQTNPDNESLLQTIVAIQSDVGAPDVASRGLPVAEVSPDDMNTAVTAPASAAQQSEQVVPVNTVPEQEESAAGGGPVLIRVTET